MGALYETEAQKAELDNVLTYEEVFRVRERVLQN